MKSDKNQFGLLSKEKREVAIREITRYFATELDQEIGLIAAEDLLDFFLVGAGAEAYKKGVEDARKLLRDRFADLEVGLDLLGGK